MTDDFDRSSKADSAPTMQAVLAEVAPMGDLSRFVIRDMTEAEEDDFFSILADA